MPDDPKDSPEQFRTTTTEGQRQKKKIIVCCDGTGQKDCPPVSNVYRIFCCIEDLDIAGVKQEKYYQRGIGTAKWNPFGILQQATGAGIGKNIRKAYRFICEKYETDQDMIYLIGYSRGAYTVRCVAQFIQDVGLLTTSDLSALTKLFSEWKEKGPNVDDSRLANIPRRTQVRIKVCAVWDTVSALGIPRPAQLDRPVSALMKLVNSGLCGNIDQAFQAIALHEHRLQFLPIVWKSNQDSLNPVSLEQCWFAGYHRDIGGGRKEECLAHIALIWMMAKLAEYLNFNPERLWGAEPKEQIWRQRYSWQRVSSWQVSDEVKRNRESQIPRLKLPLTSGSTEGTVNQTSRTFEEAKTGPSQTSHPNQPHTDWCESLPKAKETFTTDHREEAQIKDSLRGIFRAGGSKDRKPRCHFWEPEFTEIKPEADNSNEKMHSTVRAMLHSRSIRPCNSLTGVQPKEGTPHYTWQLRWKGDDSESQYTVLEDYMNGQETEWLKQWVQIEHDKILKESKPGDRRPNTEIPTLLHEFHMNERNHLKGNRRSEGWKT